MITRAILVNFRNYTGFGQIYYAPMLEFFMAQMAKYQDEFDMLYLLDSNWDIGSVKERVKIIKVNPSLTYSDAYKYVLPQVEEDLVLLVDNDLVIYREGIIRRTFLKLEPSLNNSDTYDVVSIIDDIGTYKTDKLKNGNKFCSYWFATRKELLMKYLDIDWNSTMPFAETLGLLTQAMLNDNVQVYEWEEDKSNILLEGQQDGEKSKDLGYYHIRGGSAISYLLASKNDTPEHNQQYQDYLKNQPTSEILRHAMWLWWMTTETGNVEVGKKLIELLNDLEVTPEQWTEYTERFEIYHGLD